MLPRDTIGFVQDLTPPVLARGLHAQHPELRSGECRVAVRLQMRKQKIGALPAFGYLVVGVTQSLLVEDATSMQLERCPAARLASVGDRVCEVYENVDRREPLANAGHYNRFLD